MWDLITTTTTISISVVACSEISINAWIEWNDFFSIISIYDYTTYIIYMNHILTMQIQLLCASNGVQPTNTEPSVCLLSDRMKFAERNLGQSPTQTNSRYTKSLQPGLNRVDSSTARQKHYASQFRRRITHGKNALDLFICLQFSNVL